MVAVGAQAQKSSLTQVKLAGGLEFGSEEEGGRGNGVAGSRERCKKCAPGPPLLQATQVEWRGDSF